MLTGKALVVDDYGVLGPQLNLVGGSGLVRHRTLSESTPPQRIDAPAATGGRSSVRRRVYHSQTCPVTITRAHPEDVEAAAGGRRGLRSGSGRTRSGMLVVTDVPGGQNVALGNVHALGRSTRLAERRRFFYDRRRREVTRNLVERISM